MGEWIIDEGEAFRACGIVQGGQGEVGEFAQAHAELRRGRYCGWIIAAAGKDEDDAIGLEGQE